jgi:gliding motility-associated transport system permease protein
MAGAWTIYRRELAALFFSPLAWVLLCATLLLNGALFVLYLEETGGDTGQAISFALGLLIPFWAVQIVLPPLLTMKMLSEESRSGLLEFLLTSPVSDLAVVLGKLLAATTFLWVLWSSVILYALALGGLGAHVDWGPVWGALIGACLTSALFCAIGLVASASTHVPILAAFLAFVFNVVLLLLPFLAHIAGAQPDNWQGALSRRVDVISRLQGSFTLGVFDLAHFAFFAAWTAFFVFLATQLLESRRWR